MNIIKKIAIGISALLAISSAAVPAFADTKSVNFENPPYTVGNINGQDGWTSTGNYDQAVVNSPVITGSQSFRISNAVTSGSFGDQTFSKPLDNAVGESTASAGSYPVGTRQTHFETQFDIQSTQATEQAGLAISVSPDRGDGSRMSYLRFEDQSDGIHVFFDDVTVTGGLGATADFNETDIAVLDRSTKHTIKLTLDTVDGPSNDVVKVYVDGTLKHTGTSWEDYYRYDPEASAEQNTRIVRTVLFRAGGTAVSANAGKGFLFDNLTLTSGSSVSATHPIHTADCKNNGYKNFVNDQNKPFKNQGQCVDYVNHHKHTVKGNNAQYNAYGLNRAVDFDMDTASNKGNFTYTDGNKDKYKVKVSSVMVSGNTAWFAGEVVSSKNNAYNGQWLFAKVVDNGATGDTISGSFTNKAAAESGVTNMTNPADGPFILFKGNIKVN